ncbi:MAG TPA: FCD domain-containing protein [bacterium]|nr:FCD domain-containing protein [bacterium]
MLYPVEQQAHGRPRRYTQMLDYEILKLLSDRGKPVGSGTLEIELRKRGFRISAPTVGRKLRELEVAGYLTKVSVEGRTLSEAGQMRLEELERQVNLQMSSEALHRLVADGSKKEILDLLEARRIIEREIIRLAVHKATERDIKGLERILQRQEDRVAHGELAVAEDVRFHDALAEISGNRVLRKMLDILRHQGHYTYIITYIRTRVGGRLAVDHRKILEGIVAHDEVRAQHAVDDHLRKLMLDIERYWRHALRRTSRRSKVVLPSLSSKRG